MKASKPIPSPLQPVKPRRLSTTDATGPLLEEASQVAVEAPVTIEVHGAGAYTLLCSPTDVRALAVGFLLGEGMIERLDDIFLLEECQETPGLVRVRVKDIAGARERNLLIVSSCGLCGSESVDEMLRRLPEVGESLRVPGRMLCHLSESLRRRQIVFSKSGCTHAAGVFTSDGEIISFAEDIGRHNALDKTIGKCLLARRRSAGRGVALTGRVSVEMVVKCARAGIELMSAVSAPTSLALDAARRSKITLCGFVREGRASVYSCPERVL
ncbi:MAG: formate dehydrogenase accessory sulfurtransferase FdhD [Candidatus Brocadiia bacterium]|jgi:FdhD protein|nr:formate dehydrogenase accessory sulfurtransferase FdhD [Candidatus Brocadiia bacterium]